MFDITLVIFQLFTKKPHGLILSDPIYTSMNIWHLLLSVSTLATMKLINIENHSLFHLSRSKRKRRRGRRKRRRGPEEMKLEIEEQEEEEEDS